MPSTRAPERLGSEAPRAQAMDSGVGQAERLSLFRSTKWTNRMLKDLLRLSSCAFAAAIALPQIAGASDWPMFGRSVDNLASDPGETLISKANVADLAVTYTPLGLPMRTARCPTASTPAPPPRSARHRPAGSGTVARTAPSNGAMVWPPNVEGCVTSAVCETRSCTLICRRRRAARRKRPSRCGDVTRPLTPLVRRDDDLLDGVALCPKTVAELA